MKHIYKYLAAMTAVLAGFCITSCEDEPDKFELADGVPTVRYIRPVNVESADSLLTASYMDNMICMVGDNLRSIKEIWFNDQKAILNTSYMTDHTLLVTVPNSIPDEVSDKIYMITAGKKTVEYDFKVIIPGPAVNSMSCEYTPVGEDVTIYGDYFIDDPNVPLKVIFTGGKEVTEFKSFSKNAITLTVPEGAEEGTVTVSTIYGEKESVFHYMDSRGMMFEFDGLTGLGNHGWHNREITTGDDAISGNYLVLGDADTKMSADGAWNDGKYAFEYWCGSWDTPQNVTSGDGIALHNLVDFSDFKNMALKFEMLIPSSNAWSAGAMQIAFEGYDKVTLSGNPIDGYDGTVRGANAIIFNGDEAAMGAWGRAMYRPWLSAEGGSFHTDDKWITVTIPLSSFNLDRMGAATDSVPSSPADFASLTIFVVGGGINGTECYPIIKIDNIRAVPNR